MRNTYCPIGIMLYTTPKEVVHFTIAPAVLDSFCQPSFHQNVSVKLVSRPVAVKGNTHHKKVAIPNDVASNQNLSQSYSYCNKKSNFKNA